MSREKVNQLWAKKRWIIACTLVPVMVISAVAAVLTLTCGIDFIEGGVDQMVETWKTNEASDSFKWAGLLGIPIGVWVGFLVWRWFMLRTGLLTPEEMNVIMGYDKK